MRWAGSLGIRPSSVQYAPKRSGGQNQELDKEAKVSRRMLLVGREVPTILGILLVFALVVLGALVGCGGGGSEKGQGGDGTPPSLEEAREVVVRVSARRVYPHRGPQDYSRRSADPKRHLVG